MTPDPQSLPVPLDRPNMLTALCHALTVALDPGTGPLASRTARHRHALTQAAMSAQVLAQDTPSAAPALRALEAAATAAGVELYPSQTLELFRAERERRAAFPPGFPCPACEGGGTQGGHAPGQAPVCEWCEGAGMLTPTEREAWERRAGGQP